MKPYNFCPNCGIDVKNTGFEDFGCWSCGQSMVTDGVLISPRIDKRERFLNGLTKKMSEYGLAETFFDMLIRLRSPEAYQELRKQLDYYEIHKSTYEKMINKRT